MRYTTLILSALLLVSFNSFAQKGNGKKNKKAEPALANVTDSLSYAIGVSVGKSIVKDFKEQGLDTVVDMQKLVDAMRLAMDTGTAKLLIGEEDANTFLQTYFMGLQAKQQAEEKKKFEANVANDKNFFAENGKKQGVTTTASGLQYQVLTAGTGEKPTAESTVKTHYHGTFLDGQVFDSSVERGEPAVFPVNRVIPGWTEVLQLMAVGSKWKVWLPYTLAYGEEGQPPVIPPYSTLVFEIELLGIEKGE